MKLIDADQLIQRLQNTYTLNQKCKTCRDNDCVSCFIAILRVAPEINPCEAEKQKTKRREKIW